LGTVSPEGIAQRQFFMPGYWYYHMVAEDTSTTRVLLLPAEKTIVLLRGRAFPPPLPDRHPQPVTSGSRRSRMHAGGFWRASGLFPVPILCPSTHRM